MNSRKFPQKSIGVDIAYYNNGEKQLLLQYPSSEKIIDIVENGVSIPIEEFLTYIFFHRKNPDIPNYRSYKDIEKRICQAFSYLDGYILFDGVSISGPPINPNDSIKSITEHIGEAVGLAIMNRLHGLIEADWIKISSKGGIGASPSFDYQIASTGDQFIQIEAKGSFVINNKLKPSAVSNHKTNIKEKKSKLAELAEENKDPNSSNLRYGIITVIDPNSNRKLKSWLVDPKPEKYTHNPKFLRLIARLDFLLDFITFISPRSQLTAALSTRIDDLKNMSNPFELNNIPLSRANGINFNYDYKSILDGGYNFFTNKSHLIDGTAGGILLQLSKKELFLIGIRNQLVEFASNQSFDKIMNMEFPSTTAMKTIECVVSRSRFGKLDLPKSVIETANEGKQYVKFTLDGLMHFSKGGLVFGSVFLPEE